MGEVIELGVTTTEDIPPEKILNAALKANLKDCLVVGTTQQGNVYFAMSTSDVAEINWLLDCAKMMLIDGMQIADSGVDE